MNNKNVKKIEDIDFKNLKFSSTKKTTGMRFLQVYDEKKNLDIKLPKLRIPFNTKLNLYNQLELNISLGSNTGLIDKFKEFDEQMIQFAKDQNWGLEEPFEYTPILKVSKGDYPPTLRIKFSIKDNIVDTLFYDESNKKMQVNTATDVIGLLKIGVEVYTLISCVGVWLKDSNKFGITFKVSQVKISAKKKEEPINEEYLFESDDDDFPDSELLIDE